LVNRAERRSTARAVQKDNHPNCRLGNRETGLCRKPKLERFELKLVPDPLRVSNTVSRRER
jgi:hypothetical protein